MSSRGPNEILKYLAGILLADTTIDTFCQDNFSKSISVFVGEDETQLPSDEICPLAILKVSGREMAANNTLCNASAAITLAIKDKTDNVMTQTDSGAWYYPGNDLIDEFYQIVCKVLINAPQHSSGAYVINIDSGPPDVPSFPVFKAFAALSIQYDSDF